MTEKTIKQIQQKISEFEAFYRLRAEKAKEDNIRTILDDVAEDLLYLQDWVSTKQRS